MDPSTELDHIVGPQSLAPQHYCNLAVSGQPHSTQPAKSLFRDLEGNRKVLKAAMLVLSCTADWEDPRRGLPGGEKTRC